MAFRLHKGVFGQVVSRDAEVGAGGGLYENARGHPQREEVNLLAIFLVYVVFLVICDDFLSIRCILGDIRLWVGDTSTSSCRV